MLILLSSFAIKIYTCLCHILFSVANRASATLTPLKILSFESQLYIAAHSALAEGKQPTHTQILKRTADTKPRTEGPCMSQHDSNLQCEAEQKSG